MPQTKLRIFAAPRVLISAALLSGVVLLLANLRGMPEQAHSYLSSLPLALAGIGYGLLQVTIRPGRTLLLKRLLLAATFVAWAVDQLLPPGRVALFLGDAVIGAYVLDLYWIIQKQVGTAQAVRAPEPAERLLP
jgi:hypothetical protein